MSPRPHTIEAVSTSVPAEQAWKLSDEDRQRLEAAHRRLRDAVADYNRFLGQELRPGADVKGHSVEEMGRAQAGVERAEEHLWFLREELLGWARPPSAPRAALVADWFSEQDSAYDDLDPPSSG